jgi:hypothetical protein
MVCKVILDLACEPDHIAMGSERSHAKSGVGKGHRYAGRRWRSLCRNDEDVQSRHVSVRPSAIPVAEGNERTGVPFPWFLALLAGRCEPNDVTDGWP